jgi:hypothetical protein
MLAAFDDRYAWSHTILLLRLRRVMAGSPEPVHTDTSERLFPARGLSMRSSSPARIPLLSETSIRRRWALRVE